MKKQMKKLALSKETVVMLSSPELARLRGGGDTPPQSNAWFCFGTWAGCTQTVPQTQNPQN